MAGEIASAFVRIRPNMAGFKGEVESGTRSAFSGIARTVAGSLAGLGAFKLSKFIIGSAADYEQALNVFQAVSRATGSEMESISALARELGKDMTLPATSAKDAAEAMTELAKGGLTVTDTMGAAKGALQLAAAAQIGNAEAANITARALNSFNLEGDQAVRVADVLANAANKSTGEINDFAMGLQQSSSVAHTTGLSIEQTTAALMQMAQAGVIGSDAGTSLKTMLLRLNPSTKKAKNLIQELNVSAYDSRGQFIGMENVVGKYSAVLREMSPQQRQATLMTIFGTDAIRGANIVLGQGREAYVGYRNAASESGAAAELAAAKTRGFRGAIEGFKSQIETLAIDIGLLLLPAGEQIVRFMADVVGSIDSLIAGSGEKSTGLIRVLKLEPAAWNAASADFGTRLRTAITGAIESVDWASVGRSLVAAISAGMKDAKVIGERIGEIVRGIDWNSIGKTMGPGLAAMLVSAFTTLLDPMFWIRNWDLALAVAAATWPGRILRLFSVLARPFTELGSHLILSLLNAIGRAFPTVERLLLQSILRLPGLVAGAFRALEDLVRAVFGRLGSLAVFTFRILGIQAALEAIGGFVSGAIAKFMELVNWLRSKLPALIVVALLGLPVAIAVALGQVAAQAGAAAVLIGGRIVSGVLSGLAGLAGAVKDKIESSVGWALSHVNIPGRSPPEHAAKEAVGVPLGRGVVLGFLLGVGELPEKMKDAVRNALTKARTAVQAAQATVSSAFQRLGSDAMTAFRAATDEQLDKMRTDFESKIRRSITEPMDKALRKLEGQHDAALRRLDTEEEKLTPTEQKIVDLRASREAADALRDMADARAELAEARGPEGDAAAVIRAQQRIDDLMFAKQIETLERRAERERAEVTASLERKRMAQEASYQRDQEGIANTFAQLEAKYTGEHDQQVLNYQSQRQLQERHLEDMLGDMDAQLQKQPMLWATIHGKVMDLFRNAFGPDYKTAGSNLGISFARGIQEATADAQRAAQALAATLNAALGGGPMPSLAGAGGVNIPKSAGGTMTVRVEQKTRENEILAELKRQTAAAERERNVHVTVNGSGDANSQARRALR